MGRYPPLHYHVLRALYSPVRYLDAQGVISLSEREMRTTLQLIGRGLSLLLATLSVLLVYRIGRLLIPRSSARLAALLVALTLPFVFYAKTINLESPYLFWFTLSLLFFLKVLRRHRLRDYLCLAATVALAICTKDQAYALYLGLPPVLAFSLHAHLFANKPTPRTMIQTLLDRRLILGSLFSLGLFVIIHNVLFDFQGFMNHIRVMTGPGSEPSRVFEHSVGGHVAMLAQAGRHLVFSMGWPAVVAAATGVVLAARRWKQHRHLLLLLVPVVTYYLFFIVVILYHRVRFFLPVCVVLALFAAFALGELWTSKMVRRPIAALAIAGVILLPFLRAVSLDLSMLADSRYLVETWLTNNLQPGEKALVIGNHEQRLPRGFGSMPWKRLIKEDLDLLRRRDATFLVYNTAEVQDEEELEMEAQLLDGSLNYELAFHHRYRPWLDLIDTTGVSSNLITVNPEIAVLRKVGDWGMSDQQTAEALETLKSRFQPKLWKAVRGTIHSSPFIEQRSRIGAGMAFGVHSNAWTRGTTPAALVVENQGDTRLVPTLRLRSEIPDPGLPQTVHVRAGRRTFERVFSRRGRRDLRLPPIPPGDVRMYLITTDREWRPKQDNGRLGIHIELRARFEE